MMFTLFKNLIFFLFLAVSSSCYVPKNKIADFPTGIYFHRISADKLRYEAAFRKYQSEDRRVNVQLIGVDHLALPEFYQRVSRNISKKVVVYEQSGDGAEDEKEFLSRLNSLNPTYKKRYELIAGQKNALGVVGQNTSLSYMTSAEKVCGDIPAFSQTIDYSPSFIMSYVEFIAKETIKSAGLSLANDDDLDKKLKLAVQVLNQKETKKFMSENYRKSEEASRKLVDSLMDYPDEMDWPRFSRERTYIMRNNKINLVLKDLWSRKGQLDIAVVYGAGHLPAVADFLRENNFKAIAEEWVLAAKLVP
ncbi:MAG: hypothetical protein KC505_03510 [Myxococcales bacterium]|nr:hypothetical protein [Myxococcales bacterium]USN50328.1 MAG: hypothetical protein H6731_08685 [Myxococcales bacterium]